MHLSRGSEPRCCCYGPGIQEVILVLLGLQGLGRAASWLESEWWYIVAVVPEGGVGGLLDVAEKLDVRAVAPEI
jgi:hypothetical protein